MGHLIDFAAIGVIVTFAGMFLYRTFRSSSSGCSSGCGGCKDACSTRGVRQVRQIPIKIVR